MLDANSGYHKGAAASISSCSGSCGCCSGSLSEEDDHGDDDDCMDDWEAVADALAATDQKLEQHHLGSDSCLERDESLHLSSQAEVSNGVTENETTKKKSDYRGFTSRPPVSYTAWRLDDAFHPLILPNLSKQYSEDLDFTATSFLPCTSGFVLCLFCHKKILEDGRTPGCKKQYNHEPVEGEATLDGGKLKFRLAQSCSMISRS